MWIILIVQLAMCIFVGFQKQGYQIDEILSFSLANSNNETAVPNGDGLFNQWHAPSVFTDALEVLPGNQLDYFTVYMNQVHDVHPPFFYAILHAVCSFFPSTFSKWYGLSINAVCLLLCTLVVQRIGMRIFRNPWLSLVAAAAFGFSVGAFSNFSFIRMYSLMMLLATCLFYLHIRLYQDGYSRKLIILLAACVFFGVMTHYYFIVLTCFLALFFTIVLLREKNFKTVKTYVFSVLGAGIASCLFYPALIKHIFFGARGKQAFGQVAETDNVLTDYKTVFHIINGQLFGDIIQYVLLASLLAILIRFIIASSRKNKSNPIGADSNTPLLLVFSATAVFYYVVITKVAPYTTDRYFFCIYPICVVLVAYLLYYVIGLFIKNKALIFSGVLLCMALMTALSYYGNEIDYQYKQDKAYYEMLEPYESYDCVVALNPGKGWKIKSITFFITKFDRIFVFDASEPDTSIEILNESRELSDKLVVFVEQAADQEPVIRTFLENSKFKQYTQLPATGYVDAYLFEE